MSFPRFCRCLLILLLSIGITTAGHTLEVGDRVFGSELATDIEYVAKLARQSKCVRCINYISTLILKLPSP